MQAASLYTGLGLESYSGYFTQRTQRRTGAFVGLITVFIASIVRSFDYCGTIGQYTNDLTIYAVR